MDIIKKKRKIINGIEFVLMEKIRGEVPAALISVAGTPSLTIQEFIEDTERKIETLETLVSDENILERISPQIEITTESLSAAFVNDPEDGDIVSYDGESNKLNWIQNPNVALNIDVDNINSTLDDFRRGVRSQYIQLPFQVRKAHGGIFWQDLNLPPYDGFGISMGGNNYSAGTFGYAYGAVKDIESLYGKPLAMRFTMDAVENRGWVWSRVAGTYTPVMSLSNAGHLSIRSGITLDLRDSRLSSQRIVMNIDNIGYKLADWSSFSQIPESYNYMPVVYETSEKQYGYLMKYGETTSSISPGNIGSNYSGISANRSTNSNANYAITLFTDGTIGFEGIDSLNSALGTQILDHTTNSDYIKVDAGHVHALALKSDGSYTGFGRIGEDWLNIITPNENIIDIAAGNEATYIIKEATPGDGYGEILTAGTASFVPLPNNNYTRVSCRNSHVVALRSDGTVEAFGLTNVFGELDVPEPNEDFIDVSAGGYFCLGLKSDGRIVHWGRNQSKEDNIPKPNSGYTKISAGDFHCLGLRDNGKIEIWGLRDSTGTPHQIERIGKTSSNTIIDAGGHWSSYVIFDEYIDQSVLKISTQLSAQTISATTLTATTIQGGTIYSGNVDIATMIEAGGGGISDHGALGGLLDDDHTQYYNETRLTGSVHTSLSASSLGISGDSVILQVYDHSTNGNYLNLQDVFAAGENTYYGLEIVSTGQVGTSLHTIGHIVSDTTVEAGRNMSLNVYGEEETSRLNFITSGITGGWSLYSGRSVYIEVATGDTHPGEYEFVLSSDIHDKVSINIDGDVLARRCFTYYTDEGEADGEEILSGTTWRFDPGNLASGYTWNFDRGGTQYRSGAKDFAIYWDDEKKEYHIVSIRAIASDPGNVELEYESGCSFLWAKSNNLSAGTFEEAGIIDTLTGTNIDGQAADMCWAPHLMKYDNAYYMFYTGVEFHPGTGANGGQAKQRIFCAKSYDVNNWSNPEIKYCLDGTAVWSTYSSASNWTFNARDPYVLFDEENNCWTMFLTVGVAAGYSDAGSARAAIGIATSTTLMENWELVDWVRETESGTAESPTVIKGEDGNYYLIWTWGELSWGTHIYYASSTTLSDPSGYSTIGYLSYNGAATRAFKHPHEDNLWVVPRVDPYDTAGQVGARTTGQIRFDRGLTFTGASLTPTFTAHSATTYYYSAYTNCFDEANVFEILDGHIGEKRIHLDDVELRNIFDQVYAPIGYTGGGGSTTSLPASAITEGTFSGGTYTFPDRLNAYSGLVIHRNVESLSNISALHFSGTHLDPGDYARMAYSYADNWHGFLFDLPPMEDWNSGMTINMPVQVRGDLWVTDGGNIDLEPSLASIITYSSSPHNFVTYITSASTYSPQISADTIYSGGVDISTLMGSGGGVSLPIPASGVSDGEFGGGSVSKYTFPDDIGLAGDMFCSGTTLIRFNHNSATPNQNYFRFFHSMGRFEWYGGETMFNDNIRVGSSWNTSRLYFGFSDGYMYGLSSSDFAVSDGFSASTLSGNTIYSGAVDLATLIGSGGGSTTSLPASAITEGTFSGGVYTFPDRLNAYSGLVIHRNVEESAHISALHFSGTHLDPGDYARIAYTYEPNWHGILVDLPPMSGWDSGMTINMPVQVRGDLWVTDGGNIDLENSLGSNITYSSSPHNFVTYITSASTYSPNISADTIYSGGVDIATLMGSGGGSEEAVTDADITASLEVGAITAGTLIESGTSFSDFVRSLLVTTFYPTFVNPSQTLTTPTSSNLECGTSTSIVLTVNFNRGSIVGNNSGGIWNPNLFQDYRSGAANLYQINGNNVMPPSDNYTVVGHTVEFGANTFTGRTFYNEGPQPLDSDGNNYLTPYPTGTMSQSSRIIYGRRRSFYGAVSDGSPAAYTTSTEIRALPSNTLLTSTSSISSFNINIAVGSTMVVFAYPTSYGTVDSVIYVEGLNADVTGIFDQSTVSVSGTNSYTPADYYVYTYIPAEAFDDSATYTVNV